MGMRRCSTYHLLDKLKDGITVDVGGFTHQFYGTLLVLLADTLAAHQLGGFKVGVGFSLRVCRDCMATKEMAQYKVSPHCHCLWVWGSSVYYCKCPILIL